jgi:hypothetical protein
LVADEEARRAAAEILGAEEFTRWHTDYDAWLGLLERIAQLIPDWLIDLISWIERVANTIFDWVAEFLRFFGVLGDVSKGVGWIAFCILLSALIAIGWHWQSRRSRQGITQRVPRNPGLEHQEALGEAGALARTGQYLQAAHRVQLATLALLIEFDWFELGRSDPNRTLRDRLRESALPKPESRQLIELVDRLEALWFDEPRDDRALFEDWIALDERIVSIATGS